MESNDLMNGDFFFRSFVLIFFLILSPSILAVGLVFWNFTILWVCTVMIVTQNFITDHLSECTVLKFRDQKLFIIYEKNGKKFIKFIMFIEHHIREKASLKLLFAFNMFKMTCFSQNKKIAHTMWLSIKDLWQNLIIVNPVQFYIFI